SANASDSFAKREGLARGRIASMSSPARPEKAGRDDISDLSRGIAVGFRSPASGAPVSSRCLRQRKHPWRVALYQEGNGAGAAYQERITKWTSSSQPWRSAPPSSSP